MALTSTLNVSCFFIQNIFRIQLYDKSGLMEYRGNQWKSLIIVNSSHGVVYDILNSACAMRVFERIKCLC